MDGRRYEMFGPNTYFQDDVNICYSHRDKVFFDLFSDTRNKFSNTFDLDDYDILFIPGSGTIGIESIFFSIKKRIKMIGVDGTFKRRWTDLSNTYNDKKGEVEMFCLLETSCSTPFSKEGCIVDAISGFPYYDIPSNTLAFVTCLNKQLGSYVGLSVVCVRRDAWSLFIDEGKMSYLNLARYKSYHDIAQAPSTSPTYIYEHFNKVLDNFDLEKFRSRLDRISDKIVSVIGEDNIIGCRRGPVITLKDGVIPDSLAREYDIYGFWAGRPNFQIFTYTDIEEKYDMFLEKLAAYRRGE